MKLRSSWLSLAVFVLVIFVALGSAGAAQELIVATGADPVRLDPPDQTDNISETVLRHVMDGLVEFDEEMNFVPALATSWEVVGDGEGYRFFLREGVTFHDGTPFNAEAVKFNFDRIIDGQLRRTALLKPYIKSVEVEDEFTVVMYTHFPFGALLNYLAHGASLIQSPAAIEAQGENIGRRPVGTGPFQFDRWVVGDYITLTAYEDYWGGAPELSGIRFRVVPEEATRVFQLETGEAHVVVRVPPTEVPRLEAASGTDVLIADSLRVVYIGMVVHKTPLDNVLVRRAINHAIDKNTIVDQILEGFGAPADSPIAPLTQGYYSTGGYEYNPDLARELLAEAGYPDGFDISFWTPSGRYLKDYETALVVQQMLAEVGIRADLQVIEWATYISSLFDVDKDTTEAELYLLGWAPSTGESDWVLRPLFSSDLFPPIGDNASYYANPDLDALIQAAMRETDPEARDALYAEAQKIIHEDAVWAPLHALKQVVGVRSNVEGVSILPIEIVLVKDAVIR